jgi:hypothetical protein
MTRRGGNAWRTRIALGAAAAALGIGCLVAPALAAPVKHWPAQKCVLQWTLFSVEHTHPTKHQLAGANGVLAAHGCAWRVPGPRHWSPSQCVDYQAGFYKTYGLPSDKQLAGANRALKAHACRQRVKRL